MQAKEWMSRPLNKCKYASIYVCCVAVVHGKLSQDNQWFKSLLHSTGCTHAIALTARQTTQKNTTGWTFSQTRLTPKEKTSTPHWIASSNHTHTSIAIATIAAILIKKYNESKAITTTTTKKNRRKIANCIFIRVIVVAYATGAS